MRNLILFSILLLLLTGCTPKTTSPSISIVAKQFAFEPSVINVNQRDEVTLSIKSLDVTHGISIPDYDINERLDPGKTTIIKFTADKKGEFIAHCSVYCGIKHQDMVLKIVVT